MLFAPPLAPVRVERGGEVTLGRSPECSMQLPAAAASRRHASIAWQGDRVVLRDLGSTNGTLLNGRRVEAETPLESGDRITIGGVDIRYCCVDAGTAISKMEDARTAVTLWPPSGADATEALRGDLAKVPLFAVLQMLEMGSQSGCLAVETDDGEGWMWLEAGRLVHAETAKQNGLEAAVSLAQTQAGRFDFAPGSPTPERSFQASVTEVILEATRRLDEGDDDPSPLFDEGDELD
jgi:pSer/pThr/pTyr-binding forkhead associated (FHA) protein